ncbi:hypothetical protein CYMTET_52380 [Cymbomonas tetramitiformis]|uniref:Kinesin motor domain-containing protein n=1 Tax=Cymbomonas tetramitiformis TaxID=36881 RepID=A0AAE0BJ77_9CHLO|nr:hypothetical protein CYMTET_52380 [Cymbomonas tetramitiformis]|eukprot:gene24803-30216_t
MGDNSISLSDDKDEKKNAAVQGFIRVVIRVRPLVDNERLGTWEVGPCHMADKAPLKDRQKPYQFEKIFGQATNNGQIYSEVVCDMVQAAVSAYNCTIFAYGQTGSGKTHTILGNQDDPGIMLRAFCDLFSKIDSTQDRVFCVRVAYIELYNEELYDLLSEKPMDRMGDRGLLKIVETPTRGLAVHGLREVDMSTPEQMMQVLEEGQRQRMVRSPAAGHASFFMPNCTLLEPLRVAEGKP